jgi:CubicO group peptidase (beta-lactamase class C family)
MKTARTAIAWALAGVICLALPPGRSRAQETAADGLVAAAAADPQGKRMAAAFQAWARAWNVPNASFVAMRGETVIGQAARGARTVDTPVPVASLSKAITGVCVAKLVEAGRLSYNARLSQLIPTYFKANPPYDAAARQITVRELLTHTSGLGYDPTQGSAEFAALDFRKKNLSPILAMALRVPLAVKTFRYNNVNYAALGLVIEAKTKQPYETWCRKTVLAPVGAGAATLNPQWAVMSSFGGWRISALDYARFLDHFRPASKLMKTGPAAWPKTDVNGVSYGIGVEMRRNGGSYDLLHVGDWRWTEPGRKADFAAFFAMWRQNLRFVATYAPQAASGSVGDLYDRLYAAAYPGASGAARASAPASEAAAAPAPLGGSDGGLLRD